MSDDDNTVSESDREVEDGEVDITFCSQHLQRSTADEVQNRMSDCSREHDSSQHRAVVQNSMFDRSCELDSSQHRSVRAVAENRTSDSSCEHDSSQHRAVVQNSMSCLLYTSDAADE